MSLLDYFAAKCIDLTPLAQGLATATPYKADHEYNGLTIAQVIAKEAYEVASAMLAERLKY
jgi:NTP pyrophosphatase (non-canonical NTP hydrolase)